MSTFEFGEDIINLVDFLKRNLANGFKSFSYDINIELKISLLAHEWMILYFIYLYAFSFLKCVKLIQTLGINVANKNASFNNQL